jgi:hypothetical protein
MVNPMGVVEKLGHFFPFQHHLIGDLEVPDILDIQTLQEPEQDIVLFMRCSLRILYLK